MGVRNIIKNKYNNEFSMNELRRYRQGIMAVVKSPIISNTTSSLDDFDAAVALISERINGDKSKYWSDRMATVAAGITKPSRQQMEALKLMFDKNVPDAPRTFDINSKESVEVTIKTFLENNQANQAFALQKARDISRREEEITLALEASL